MTTTATANTADAVTLLAAELALIGRTPTDADIRAVMRTGFRPAKYLILVDGKGYRLVDARLHAKVAARSAGHIHPEAVVEVEYRPTGERAVAAIDGSFFHYEGVYHWSPAVLAADSR